SGYALELTGHQRAVEPSQHLLSYYSHAAMVSMDTLYPAERDRRPRVALPTSTAFPAIGAPAVARAWLEAERANLLAMVRLADVNGWARWIGELAGTLWRALDAQAHNADALAMHHVALSAAEGEEDRVAEADALRNLSTAYRTAGHYVESLDFARRSATLRSRLGDERGEAAAHNSIGVVAGLLGRIDEAFAAYERSLTLRRKTGDLRGEAAVRLNLAVTAMRVDAREHVEEHLTRALRIFREIGDRPGEAHALNNLGDVYRAESRYAAALEHHERALALYRQLSARDGNADALNGIALDHAAAGELTTALMFHEQALELAENGHHGILNDIHNSMGTTLFGLGRLGEPRDHHEIARALAVEAGDRFEQARALSGIAETLARDDLEGAQQLWASALSLYEDMKLPAADYIRIRIATSQARRQRQQGA